MGWNILILDPTQYCAPLFCTELHARAGQEVLTKDAPFVVVLASSGRATVAAGDDTLLIGAGNVLLARGAVSLSCTAEMHVLAAGFAGSAAIAAAQSLQTLLAAQPATCPLAGQTLAALLAAHTHGAPAQDLSALAYAVLCAVAQADSTAQTLPPLVAQAMQAMRENYAELYGVEELSVHLGVSKSHLVRVFSAAVGTTPGQYLTRVRVAAAKQLLLHRVYTLDVVASLCGFSGANYLCKVFKKETGLTPAAYRAQNIGRAPHRDDESEWERALYI